MSTKTLSKIIATALLTVACSPAATPTVTIFDQFFMHRKVDMATKYFEKVWSQIFANRGARYSTPKIISYTGSVSTGCGVLGSNHAFYCGADKNIYYDAVFFAGMMKAAGDYLSTDGDYAPIVILAHEWGHAVQAQLDSASFIGLFRENMADCLAGAITQQAAFDRYLDRGDLEEARYALVRGGDAPGKTWIFDKDAHGSAATRVGEFNKGYQGGVRACQVFESSRLGSQGEPAAQVVRTFDEILRGIQQAGR